MKTSFFSLVRLAVILCALGGLSEAAAQRFAVVPIKISSGAGQAHGGDFSAAGAVGAPVGQVSTNAVATRKVEHGVATDALPFEVPIRTSLSLSSGTNSVRLQWAPAYRNRRLEFTDTLRNPLWTRYPTSGTNFVVVPTGTLQLYFRISDPNAGQD